jgi:hypothetical protein
MDPPDASIPFPDLDGIHVDHGKRRAAGVAAAFSTDDGHSTSNAIHDGDTLGFQQCGDPRHAAHFSFLHRAP